MTAVMHKADQVYLSVIFWPDGMAREEVAALIADAAKIDRRSVQLKLGKSPPTILGLFPRLTADLAVTALQRNGGDAFATSINDLESLGPTLKIRDLRLDSGVIHAELWRGTPARIRPCDIQVLIRARLSEKQKMMPSVLETAARTRWATPHNRVLGMWAYGGAFGIAAGFGYAYLGAEYDLSTGITPTTPTDVRHSHKLDLHTTNGKVYQIDGDKFGFQILGELRGPSDNANIDAMCELIATLNSDVIVDPYFSLWRPPAGHHRLRLPMMQVNNEDPAFAFYSRWTTLMYRHILTNRPAA